MARKGLNVESSSGRGVCERCSTGMESSIGGLLSLQKKPILLQNGDGNHIWKLGLLQDGKDDIGIVLNQFLLQEEPAE